MSIYRASEDLGDGNQLSSCVVWILNHFQGETVSSGHLLHVSQPYKLLLAHCVFEAECVRVVLGLIGSQPVSNICVCNICT